jgi:hypothetical protein
MPTASEHGKFSRGKDCKTTGVSIQTNSVFRQTHALKKHKTEVFTATIQLGFFA